MSAVPAPAPAGAPDERARWGTLLGICATAAGVTILAVYFTSAARLLSYPWDWSTNEGLVLDYARRILTDFRSLYPRDTVVPSPDFYGPVLPLLLGPAVAWFPEPWLPARLLAMGWSAAIAGAVYLLVRQRSRPSLALLSAALVFAPLGLSVFYMVLRADGPMIALWLWAAYLLLPERLDGACPPLGRRRLLVGATLLVASVLCKPTAVLHGAPLVAAWMWADRRSARRLAVAVGALGLGTLLLLQLVTSGGYLAVMALWGIHRVVPGQLWTQLAWFVQTSWPLLALAAASLAWALRAGGGQWRDPALALVMGGALLLPGLRKGGASFNYFLPLLCALVVLAGRYWSTRRPTATHAVGPEALDGQSIGALAGTVVGLWLVHAQVFPLPTVEDAATARVFYGFITEKAAGGPILATTPDYAYYLIGQPVEVEGSSLPYLVAGRAAGIDAILRRLQTGSYRVVATTPRYWPWDPAYADALARNYRPVAACWPGFFFGHPLVFVLHLPRESTGSFQPVPSARCQAYTGPPSP